MTRAGTMGLAARCEKLMCVAHDFASCGLLGWSSRAMMPATTWQKAKWIMARPGHAANITHGSESNSSFAHIVK